MHRFRARGCLLLLIFVGICAFICMCTFSFSALECVCVCVCAQREKECMCMCLFENEAFFITGRWGERGRGKGPLARGGGAVT